MLLLALNGAGQPATFVVQAQDAITDRSGTVNATGQSQPLMAANTNRSGWYFQNRGQNPMALSEIGANAAASGSILVLPGQSFPPPGYAIPTGAMTVAGTATDPYTAREW